MELVQEETRSVQEKLRSLQNRLNQLTLLENKLRSINDNSCIRRQGVRGGVSDNITNTNNETTIVHIGDVHDVVDSAVGSPQQQQEQQQQANDRSNNNVNARTISDARNTNSISSVSSSPSSTNILRTIQQIIVLIQYDYFTIRQAIDQYPYLSYTTEFWLLYLQSQVRYSTTVITTCSKNANAITTTTTTTLADTDDTYSSSNSNDDETKIRTKIRTTTTQSSSSSSTNAILNRLEFSDLLFERTSDEIQYNKEIMVLACLYDIRIYERITIRDTTTSTPPPHGITPQSTTNTPTTSSRTRSATVVAATTTTVTSTSNNSTDTAGILFSHDEDIIRAALDCSPLNVLHVDSYGQLLYPILIASALIKLPLKGNDELQKQLKYHLDYKVWKQQCIVYAWITAGGLYLENHFAPKFRDDPQLLLLYLQQQQQQQNTNSSTSNNGNSRSSSAVGIPSTVHSNGNDTTMLLPSLSPRLLNDKDFMLQALRINGRLLSSIMKDNQRNNILQNDLDIVVTAFCDLSTLLYFGLYTKLYWNTTSNFVRATSRSRSITTDTESNNNNKNHHYCNWNYEYMVYLSNAIQQRLRPYNNWITILCAISQHKSTNGTTTVEADSQSDIVVASQGSNHSRPVAVSSQDQIHRLSITSASSSSSHNNNNRIFSIPSTTTNNNNQYCYLTMLNQGIETKVEAYSKLIAEYIGIPTGHNLIALRETASNIALLWGL